MYIDVDTMIQKEQSSGKAIQQLVGLNVYLLHGDLYKIS